MGRKKLVNQAIRQECIWDSTAHKIYTKTDNHGIFDGITMVLNKDNPYSPDSQKIVSIRSKINDIQGLTVSRIHKQENILMLDVILNKSRYSIKLNCTTKKLSCIITGIGFTMKLTIDDIKKIPQLYKLIQTVIKTYKEN